jgi:hypothetical protein
MSDTVEHEEIKMRLLRQLETDMNRLEWIEEHKPEMWFSRECGWVVSTDPSKRFVAATLADAIDMARADKDREKI